MSRWDNIELMYSPPEIMIKSGMRVGLSVMLNTSLDEYDRENLASVIDTWIFPKDGKYIRPFKLQNFSPAEKFARI